MSIRRSTSSGTSLEIDTSQRKSQYGFAFALGSYPEEKFVQRVGYDSKYIREGDYFYYQIALSHENIMPVLLRLFNTLPDSVFIVTQVHTNDYYREYDTYVTKGVVGKDDFIQWVRDWFDVVLDDGCFGIGAFVEDPSMEVFIDEHKTIHIYHHNPDFMEHMLEGMDIPFVLDLRFFWDTPHFHVPLNTGEPNNKNYLTAFENLADKYNLHFNDAEGNADGGRDKSPGITCWRVQIRGYKQVSVSADKLERFYCTLYLNAESRKEVTGLVEGYMNSKNEFADLYLQMARIPEETLASTLQLNNIDPHKPCVWFESNRLYTD